MINWLHLVVKIILVQAVNTFLMETAWSVIPIAKLVMVQVSIIAIHANQKRFWLVDNAVAHAQIVIEQTVDHV